MNRVFVTGATGFLGMCLVKRLVKEGNLVHALYRSEEKIKGWEDENLFFFRGNLGDRGSIERAMRNCNQVYHLLPLHLCGQKILEYFTGKMSMEQFMFLKQRLRIM